ncbi:NAD(P)-dependent oxidoreductase [Candidatus Sumerlaeota bacterium]|nr:NAD(P)-dependent oxidoreductase [Candidatus Sumerlaeota bacterium]
MRIGFLGLGVMGASMAGHLQKKFPNIVVWNRTRERCAALGKAGAETAASPAEVAAMCDVLCVCVSDTPDVEAVVFGKGGVAESIRPGSLLIDFSTISAAGTENFAERLRAKNCAWVDSPMSGGDVGARNAALTLMVGASDADYQRALPVLQAVGNRISHMGAVGTGQKTKLANQIAAIGTLISLGESLNFARESGMDVERVWSVISSGAAGSWSLSNYGPRVLRGDWKPDSRRR